MFFNKNAKLLEEVQQQLQAVNLENEHLTKSLQDCTSQINILRSKYSGLINLDNTADEKKQEISRINGQLEEMNVKFKQALEVHKQLQGEVNLYQDTLEIGSFGLYKPQHNLESSEKYKQALDVNFEKQKALIKYDKAAVCSTEWTVGGSKVEGQKMVNQYKKLMLFAFNGECDGLIAKVKWNNATKTKERIMKSFESINKLGVTQQVAITQPYLQLKLEELSLTYEYEEKRYQEKEEQRMIREQMREEERAQRELEKAQKEAMDEERRYQSALDKAREELKHSNAANADILAEKVKLLEERLAGAHERKERAIAMAQLTKVGHIYVISNLGSFGEDIYKIGMTRRLDPMDRVKELGDASVPFQFDVHAIIYSDNAPQLEYELHKQFHERRLNRINHKKEFFKITLTEIERFILQHTNAEIQFTQIAEAREYRESMTIVHEVPESVTVPVVPQRFPASLI